VVQIEYSILNQSVLQGITMAKRPNQEVVVRSVLCRGLLSSNPPALPGMPSAVRSTLAKLDQLARSWAFSLSELAIRFALDSPGVDIVLVGVADQQELDAALRVADLPCLNRDQMQTLKEFDLASLDFVHPERWA
jgi:aryl-alcohol dehydrogenase-like predicted oxidoreductase